MKASFLAIGLFSLLAACSPVLQVFRHPTLKISYCEGPQLMNTRKLRAKLPLMTGQAQLLGLSAAWRNTSREAKLPLMTGQAQLHELSVAWRSTRREAKLPLMTGRSHISGISVAHSTLTKATPLWIQTSNLYLGKPT
jgi:hypothetical protein